MSRRPLSQLLDGPDDHVARGEATHGHVKAALDFTLLLTEAIRAAGTIPSGHLYAAVMPSGCSLAYYESCVEMLKRIGLVAEEAHVLRWTGPAFDAEGKRVP